MRKNFRKFRLLAITLVLVAIILIAFVGIYGKKLNAYTNLIPKFELGMDLFGKRELIFNPSTESSEKQVYVDNEGKKHTNTAGHKDRIIHYDEELLKVVGKVFENTDEWQSSGRLQGYD